MNFDERMISEHEAELNLYASMLDRFGVDDNMHGDATGMLENI